MDLLLIRLGSFQFGILFKLQVLQLVQLLQINIVKTLFFLSVELRRVEGNSIVKNVIVVCDIEYAVLRIDDVFVERQNFLARSEHIFLKASKLLIMKVAVSS